MTGAMTAAGHLDDERQRSEAAVRIIGVEAAPAQMPGLWSGSAS